MLVLYMNCSAYGVFCLSIQFLSRHSLCLLIYFYLYMSTRKPIKDREELLKLSNIDLDKELLDLLDKEINRLNLCLCETQYLEDPQAVKEILKNGNEDVIEYLESLYEIGEDIQI